MANGAIGASRTWRGYAPLPSRDYLPKETRLTGHRPVRSYDLVAYCAIPGFSRGPNFGTLYAVSGQISLTGIKAPGTPGFRHCQGHRGGPHINITNVPFLLLTFLPFRNLHLRLSQQQE